MAEQIFLSDSRTAVDRKYVGFTPNGGSIKPVHVASGVLRSIYGKYNTTMSIKRLALVSDAKGVVPKGNELDTIYDLMKEREKIEESVTPNALESLRNVMQRLLSADKGVYVVKGLKDDMISYSAGSSYFITRRSMYEDTGEFIGGLIKEYKSDLYIEDTKTLIEIKSILSFQKTALFPTVYSERGIKQLVQLSSLLDEGFKVCYLFASFSHHVREIQINDGIEKYACLFNVCLEKGMTVYGVTLKMKDGCPIIHSIIPVLVG